MIDIHSHILPGIDDGAAKESDSIEMGKLAVKEGIHTIIATPHHQKHRYETNKQDILNRVRDLNNLFEKEKISLKVLAGQEISIYGDIIPEYKQGKILSLNDGGRYILIEFPMTIVPNFTEQLFYDLQLEGLTPIIAHPERNQEIFENPNLIYEFVRKGALTQINTSSLMGKFGSKIQKLSMKLIEANLTHFIASDAHNIKKRNFKMDQAFSKIKKKFDLDTVDYFMNNSDLLVQGKQIVKEQPNKIKKKKVLGVL
ncbi:MULTISPECIES: tyrosine-protein phosphatase [Bacillus]|uniref:tyrosine-protein phosphatase n=1 Tax=Bacillus TaxID=1386 RepID=UPI0002EA7975|nr:MULTISPECIES: CpsB/CapC family capsule biosynthesis tyrosine phosphatase [Bacillus]